MRSCCCLRCLGGGERGDDGGEPFFLMLLLGLWRHGTMVGVLVIPIVLQQKVNKLTILSPTTAMLASSSFQLHLICLAMRSQYLVFNLFSSYDLTI